MTATSLRIVFLGAGNLATAMAKQMQMHDLNIVQIYSRTNASAQKLAASIGCKSCHAMENILPDGDLYIIAIPDHAIVPFVQHLSLQGRLVVHTSAATPMQALQSATDRCGVFYPLQTFSPNRIPPTTGTPLFLEATAEKDLLVLQSVAEQLRCQIHFADITIRKQVHLAAAFACNFTNHLYHISEQLLREKNLSFDLLLPLIRETVDKLANTSPQKAQTGPAVRSDMETLRSHLALLTEHPHWTVLYQMLSEGINPSLEL